MNNAWKQGLLTMIQWYPYLMKAALSCVHNNFTVLTLSLLLKFDLEIIVFVLSVFEVFYMKIIFKCFGDTWRECK